ncbi:MAG TPA: YicC family protein [Saprospiraceae bacterium]|nr:YicC family protein [Saprospiraceae bacterium]
MLFSMTGFGRDERKFVDKMITVELKSLNSKGLDIRVRSSVNLGEKEILLRKMLADALFRGKIDVNITVQHLDESPNHTINVPLFKQYYRTLKSVSDELGIERPEFISSIMRIPSVVEASNQIISEKDWSDIQVVFDRAVEKLVAFRQNEGNSLKLEFRAQTQRILDLLSQVPQYEGGRSDKLRLRLDKLLREYLGSENIDANRFEQEILYFLDKVDISEEKLRLDKHCHHFLEKLDSKEPRKGRVLSFISQEMGREINTLGAKANSSDLQVIVVKMKEALEKIKEQVLNAL